MMEKNKIYVYLYNTLIVLCLLCGAVYVVSQFVHFGSGKFTDNARVCQNVVPQSCRVQGFIREVRFTDFQQVKKGDTLVIIEDAEFRLRLAQAETDLIRAEQGSKGTASSIVTTKTSMSVTEAGIESARVQMENAQREDNRFKNLLNRDAVTPQQYDKVHTAYLSAKAAYEQVVRSRHMQSAVVAEQGHHLSASEQGIELARRAVDLARLNLSYCYIIATCDGLSARRTFMQDSLSTRGRHWSVLWIRMSVGLRRTTRKVRCRISRWAIKWRLRQMPFPAWNIRVRWKASPMLQAVLSHSFLSTMPPAIS